MLSLGLNTQVTDALMWSIIQRSLQIDGAIGTYSGTHTHSSSVIRVNL